MTEFTKSEAAILDYTVDWSGVLHDGEAITVSEFISSAPDSELSLGTPNLTGAQHTVFVSGGVGGRAYRVTSRITTDAARVHEQDFALTVTRSLEPIPEE